MKSTPHYISRAPLDSVDITFTAEEARYIYYHLRLAREAIAREGGTVIPEIFDLEAELEKAFKGIA